jgi:hypothetical protein
MDHVPIQIVRVPFLLPDMALWVLTFSCQVGVSTVLNITARDRFGNRKHDSADSVVVEYFIREGEVGPPASAGGFIAAAASPGVYLKPLSPLTTSTRGMSLRVRVNAIQVNPHPSPTRASA